MGRALLMLTPALLVVVGLFGGGLAVSVAESVGYFEGGALTLRHYSGLAEDVEVRASLGITLGVAVAVTALSATGGLLIAVVLRPQGRWTTLLQVPVAIPHLTFAFVLMHLLSPSGVVARVGHALGWTPEPADFPELIQDPYGIGIVIAYVLKETPFVAVMLVAVLARVGRGYDDAARTLGAGRWQRFRHVTLPLLWAPLISSSVFVFAYVLSAFEAPFLLGRPYPAMIPVVAQRRFVSPDLAERPEAVALAVTASALTAVLVWIYLRFARNILGIKDPVIF